MAALIFFTILSAIGATFIVTRSTLFQDFRELFMEHEFFLTLFSCPQCLGFWVGTIFAFLTMPLVTLVPYGFILYAFGTGCSTSGLCFIINEILEK